MIVVNFLFCQVTEEAVDFKEEKEEGLFQANAVSEMDAERDRAMPKLETRSADRQ
jgi:hypothetical protein